MSKIVFVRIVDIENQEILLETFVEKHTIFKFIKQIRKYKGDKGVFNKIYKRITLNW